VELKSLHDLFMDELKDLYSAENQLLKALPKMAKKASSADVRKGFEKHLKETHQQVERLDQAGRLLEVSLRGKKCAAMEGLIQEGKELMEEKAEPAVMDAALIAAAQKVEHYEIASYGTVCTWAKELGLDRVAQLLGETLAEEKATDEKLTELAEGGINQEADGVGTAAIANGHSKPQRKPAGKK
jgi:ferritin-like metal-binding protein YciE